MSDDTIHDGEWVKVKCWKCGGTGSITYTDDDSGWASIGRCDECLSRGWLMQFLGLKPAPGTVKEGAD